jgi:putative transposase
MLNPGATVSQRCGQRCERKPRIPHLSPTRRRACIEHVRHELHVSERRACVALGQHRSTQRRVPRGHQDEKRLTADIIELARRYGRYGYRKIAALLRDAGWLVNDKRVERIWLRQGAIRLRR